jgi:hypothetical protein
MRCMIELDGKTVYAGTAHVRRGEMTLGLLSNKKFMRDLVAEIAPPTERFAQSWQISKRHDGYDSFSSFLAFTP